MNSSNRFHGTAPGLRIIFTGFLILFTLFFTGSGLSAQSLSFNDILLVTAADTVPAGKTWKVTSVMGTDNMYVYPGTSSGQTNLITITVNGVTVYTKASWGASGATSAIEVTDMPMWLPAGTAIAPSTGAYGISIIEFNITP